MSASFPFLQPVSEPIPENPSIATARTRWLWPAALAVFVLFWQFGEGLAKWAFSYPRALEIPAARWIGKATKWLLDEASFGLFTFTDLTRFVAEIIDLPYRVALGLLSTGLLSGQGSSAVQQLPPLSWLAVLAIVALIGHHAGGEPLGVAHAAGCS